jgi:tetratricopeptide (TPR) repeat protein
MSRPQGAIAQEEGHAVESDSVLAAALLGHGLPDEAEDHLWEASQSYHDEALAEAHLREAEAIAPDHAAVLIGLYRFYFYKGRLADALTVARACLAKAGRENNFSTDWRCVRPGDAAFDRYEEILPRFFLFSLKGYAYLQMRLGNIEEGLSAVDKLLELDAGDKIGARVLLEVANRRGAEDDD